MNASAQGDQALSNSDPLSAIKHYTQALVELPRAPIYYIKRSTAHSRVKAADGGPRSAAALQDAEIALVLARERGRRELMLSAQMRRGVALYQLERVGDAGFVFDTIKEKTTGVGGQTKDRTEEVRDAMASKSAKNGYDQELPIWMAKVKGRLRKLEEGDEKGKVSVGEYPSSVQIPTEKELKEQLAHIKAGKVVTGGGDFPKSVPVGEQKPQDAVNTTTQSSQGGVTAPAAAPAAPGPVNVRHEWYQSHDSVVVTLYVKGIAKEKVNSDIENDSINIQFPLPTGTDYAFSLDPLFAPIDPSASKISVMGTKIEIILHKQTSGQKWSSLESTATGTKLTDRAATTAPNPKPAAADAASPSYPTSSRHGVKNWDKVASELTTKPKSKSEKKDDAGNDTKEADSDEEGGDCVDSFFKKLYAGADPDTRRAMMKSYVESQGTSLSTNWGEVSQGKVEPKP